MRNVQQPFRPATGVERTESFLEEACPLAEGVRGTNATRRCEGTDITAGKQE